MINIKIVSPEVVRPLRHKVLRPTLPFESSIMPNDGDASSIHFACFNGDTVLSVASFFQEPFASMPEKSAYRLRGMATQTNEQGKGYGTKILTEAKRYLKTNTKTKLVWCNARTTAFGFYENCGFNIVGEEFDIPNLGPHKTGYIEL